ncbi:MAG: kinase/pyrophosphorylase [Eggerthellaceae bacterium]|nr:kinase/pyrophosphorylase [Eggerthellaceae bacterium]
MIARENTGPLPTIHIISDSVGITGQAVARAAASQFGETNPRIEILSKVSSIDEIIDFCEQHSLLHEEVYGDGRLLVFYTLVDRELSEGLASYLLSNPKIIAVDLMSDAVSAIADFGNLTPSTKPGTLHEVDTNYFKRIEAIEFSISHDDGRNPQDLRKADIVLIGVSRSSKTPLSIYLSQEGYRVANVPLDLHTQPPKQLFDVDPKRIFGLMTTPEVLIGIRKRRLGSANVVASGYADPESVYLDLEKAHALMRKIGCIVIHTDNRAVEETAQEILRYYELAFPWS